MILLPSLIALSFTSESSTSKRQEQSSKKLKSYKYKMF